MEPPQNLEKGLSSKSSSRRLDFHFLTLFPESLSSILQSSLLGKAQKKGLVSFNLVQIRDFAADKHRTVDDTPYGGGEGMLLKADVLHAAWKSVSTPSAITVLLSPQGKPLTQDVAKELSQYSNVILVCGHYEGVDERFIELCVDREISIGDYVLTGGELPALVIADTVTRLLPGVVGNGRSISEDSLENGLLKYPQYTKPREFNGLSVPDLLLEGNHQVIRDWREAQMRERTQRKRPDLWESFLKRLSQLKKS